MTNESEEVGVLVFFGECERIHWTNRMNTSSIVSG